ncbi:MAG TPA: mandelate racemase/muconate lactonizing enzyme family protein [bacterium]|nr:mandelate racemase/muconate lactonizing enzyme family protein [bacterium]HPN45885.1 mandelate racemase/muconate lactonizing enzyme family protein [bacterium]
MTITDTHSAYEREPLIRPFGFKGGYMNECWQVVTMLENERGQHAIGLATQNVLWSDAAVFIRYGEQQGNTLMVALLNYALGLVRGQEFASPMQLFETIWPQVYEYGKILTGLPDLQETFALNALVSLDNAAWLLYAQVNNITNFDDLLPEQYRPAMAYKYNRLAAIPLISYNATMDDLCELLKQEYFFFKIKLGSPGAPEEMLEWDKQRITQIHKLLGGLETPYTANGAIPYYFDANGRYPDKETFLRLLDHLDQIGALAQTTLIEEPFPPDYDADVHNLGVRLAADESAHTDQHTLQRIHMGYSAIALKPIAKTLSMTLKIAAVAHKFNIPCFCADLTVNPILVEWNKNIAARLGPFPGLHIGLLETNGHQNYRNWAAMRSYHPAPNSPWAMAANGLFTLDESFYMESGGIFQLPGHYKELVN